MPVRRPYLTRGRIEQEAEHLLARHEKICGMPVKPPVPVADIADLALIRHELFDLYKFFQVPTRDPFRIYSAQFDLYEIYPDPTRRDPPLIHSALLFDKELALIDHSLNPRKSRSSWEGYRLSMAHQIGHWKLHRNYMAGKSDQALPCDRKSKTTIVCLSSGTTEPTEMQAKYFSACLLMPKRLVFEMWEDHFGRREPLVPTGPLSDKSVMVPPKGQKLRRELIEQDASHDTSPDFPGDPISELPLPPDDEMDCDDALFELFFRTELASIARIFGVSVSTILHRLAEIGLLYKRPRDESSWVS